MRRPAKDDFRQDRLVQLHQGGTGGQQGLRLGPEHLHHVTAQLLALGNVASPSLTSADFEPLVREGHADSLIEAALRYVIVQRAVSTVLVGYSTLEQLEYAARSIEKGPLSPAALDRVADIQRGFVGEPR